MQRHWKRYLLLMALVAILLYVAWRMYADYELSAYPQRVADSIPVPPGVRLIDQRNDVDKACRAAGIVRYYATDLTWEQVLSVYQNYLGASPWKPFIPNEHYNWSQSPANQKLNLIFHEIKDTEDNIGEVERKTLNSGKTAYLLQVSYIEDIAAWERNCKPDD